MKLDLWTDSPEHLRNVKRIWLDDEVTPRERAGDRFQDGRALIRIAGITTPEQARELTGKVVRISGEDAEPLGEGEYYLFQLIGLKVITEDGEEIGTVTDLMETGANDVLVITPSAGGPDVLYPLHPEFVLSVDPPGGTILVRRLEYAN
jgi:16S rRNA processing protein RimM